MPLRLLLKNDHAFGPEEVILLTSTFERALATLGLSDREDPATLEVARRMLEAAKQGERAPACLHDHATGAD